MKTRIKFSANWDSECITIKCPTTYSEKYVRKILRERLEKVFGSQNFVVWIDRSLPNASEYYTFEVTKRFNFEGIPLIPLNKAALNYG